LFLVNSDSDYNSDSEVVKHLSGESHKATYIFNLKSHKKIGPKNA